MIRPAAVVLACLALAAAPLRGQSETQLLTATATILEPPMTGGGLRSIDFGSVAIGGSADTGPGAEGSTNTAKWEFGSLRKSASVQLTFTLPNLTRGTHSLPVTWANPGYGTWCTRRAPATETACGGAGTLTGSFNPGTPGTISTTPAGAGNNDRILTIWVGARIVNVPANLPPGTYTGTATLVITIL